MNKIHAKSHPKSELCAQGTLLFKDRSSLKLTGVISGGGGCSEELWDHSPSASVQRIQREPSDRWEGIDQYRTLVRLTSRQARDAAPWGLSGLQFYNQRQSGEGRRASLSFLSGRHASIISSSSRLGRGVFLSPNDQTRSTSYCFCLRADSMSGGSLTSWAHRVGCGAQVTIALLFGGHVSGFCTWFYC